MSGGGSAATGAGGAGGSTGTGAGGTPGGGGEGLVGGGGPVEEVRSTWKVGAAGNIERSI